MKALLLFVFLATARGALGDHWILFTDRKDNDLITEYLLMSDLSEAGTASSALGKRQDSFIADIIIRLLEPFSGRSGYEREHLLRLVLARVFPADLPEGALRAKLRGNEEALARLAATAGSLGPPLRCEVLRLLCFSVSAEYDGYILAQGALLIAGLQERQGKADAEHTRLLRSFLEYADARGSPDFLEPVVRILKLARSPELAAKSLEVASRLAGIRKASRNPEGW